MASMTQEHISGPLGQPHTQSTLMCIFSQVPPGTSQERIFAETGDVTARLEGSCSQEL